jgi:hypothetical protein
LEANTISAAPLPPLSRDHAVSLRVRSAHSELEAAAKTLATLLQGASRDGSEAIGRADALLHVMRSVAPVSIDVPDKAVQWGLGYAVVTLVTSMQATRIAVPSRKHRGGCAYSNLESVLCTHPQRERPLNPNRRWQTRFSRGTFSLKITRQPRKMRAPAI